MKPTHRLKALNKLTNARTEVGAGWLNQDGSISVRLNPCVVLTPDLDITLTLFPEGVEKRELSPMEKAARDAKLKGPIAPNAGANYHEEE